MNDGKSQTFLYYASTVMDQFQNTTTPIDYAMKIDTDSLWSLHDLLEFCYEHLPPAPYNVNIIAGAVLDKANWAKDRHPRKDSERFESFWNTELNRVHLYMAGQCYLVSHNLCHFVAQETHLSKTRVAPGGYIEGIEDHDIFSMIFHSPTPIHAIVIGKSQQFWQHPIKGHINRYVLEVLRFLVMLLVCVCV
jgi:hypothetical protein